MASEFYFAIPGDLNTLTGGFIYDKRMIEALQNGVMPVRPLVWPASFPFPADDDYASVAASLAALPDDSVVLVDGLAFGALPALMAAEAERLRLLALVHHPLGYETGLLRETQHRLIETERRALLAARLIIATSHTTARTLMNDFGARANRVKVVAPGTDPPREQRLPRPANDIPLLLSVGAVIPRKGHDLLVRALGRMQDLPWRCMIAGSLVRDPRETSRLHNLLTASALETRVELLGEVDDVDRLYGQADIFVLASHYEGYGMAFAEALQFGLPIIGTVGGAIPEVVPPRAGLLSAPGDVPQLTASLRSVLTDASLRQALAQGARQAGAALRNWHETACMLADVVRNLI